MNWNSDLNTMALPATPATAATCGARALQRLRDWVPIRTMAAHHRKQVSAHLLALDANDRQRRFGHAIHDDRLQAYAEQLDFDRDQIFGIFDRRLRLVALGHLALGTRADSGSPDGNAGSSSTGSNNSGHGELGLSVLATARGRGLGTRLFEHAVMHARNRDVHTLHIRLARDNTPMLAIVQRAGARIELDGSDALAVLPLACETLGSQIGELLGERAAALDFRLKVQTLRAGVPSAVAR